MTFRDYAIAEQKWQITQEKKINVETLQDAWRPVRVIYEHKTLLLSTVPFIPAWTSNCA